MSKMAIIIGAGPAGLTAAYELLKRTDVIPVILEKSADIGGISKTVNYKGNRIDIGGHRFFSKSDRVMNWWFNIMPVQTDEKGGVTVSYQNKSRQVESSSGDITDPDKVMLVRKRLSRIYFLRKFFAYPIQLSLDTLSKLGLWTTIAIMCSYLKAQLLPRKPEKNLEDFMVNRFGQVLYKLFFKDYTEKVWGIPCNSISAEWGAQRIKGVSIRKAIEHAIQTTMKHRQKRNDSDVAQKDTETSLIEQFLYPKFGPGQLWEEVARQVEQMGGKILMHHDVKRIYTSDDNNKITAVAATNNITGETSYLEGDYFFSTMPVQELIGGMDGTIPDQVKEVASGLQYRDFITVGILLKQMSFQDKKTGEWKPLSLKDTWIYIQEKDVTVGRLQVFNNWSPYLVKDPDTTWIGMEFFCNKNEDFWNKPDAEIKQIAIQELEKIGLASSANVLDSTVIRMEKTYPAYFGTYDRFDVVREYTDRFKNLFLVGRNGMHKYNNSDHSMLTAMVAVDNICANVTNKENIWEINTEQQYHEEKITEKSSEEENVEMKKTFPAPAWRNNQILVDYIFKNPVQKWYVWIGIVGIITQFAIFKYLYPFASFINGDSYVYLETAYHNFDINTYPIGYPKFLRLFSVFTKSDTALVTFQYLFLQFSMQYLLFSLFFFYRPARITKALMFCCLTFNPVFLYIANYISSDAFFLSLSLIWFTQLFWIIYRPTSWLIIANALVLFLAFTVRYNALYYPIITGVALLLSRDRPFIKITGLVISIILIASFVQFTSNKYSKSIGKRQFSPFTGWQMANNAMYAYRYVDRKSIKEVPARFRQLDKTIMTFFDTTRNIKEQPYQMFEISTVYMWDPRSPLQQYMKNQFKKDSTTSSLKKWATVAPLFGEYGTFIIKQYPMEFAKHYLLPNALKYYTPPLEFLENYSTGIDSVPLIVTTWFGYKSNKLKSHFKDFKVNSLNFYPIFAGVVNVVFLCGFASFLFLKGPKKYQFFTKGLLLAMALWIVNFAFSVFASPIALRFQLFPLILFQSFVLLFVEYLLHETQGMEITRLKAGTENLNPDNRGLIA